MKLQCPDDYCVRMVDFPGDVLAAVRVDDSGYYTIYINDRLSMQAKREALKHELTHIIQGDFDNHLTIYDIEARACADEKLPRINMQSRKRFVTDNEFLSLIEIGKNSIRGHSRRDTLHRSAMDARTHV